MTDRQISRRLVTGIWIPVRPGFMKLSASAVDRVRVLHSEPSVVPATSTAFEQDWAIHAHLIANRSRELVASHLSAAYLHGLSEPLGGWRRPTATASSGYVRNRNGGRVLVAPMPEIDIDKRRGLPVTSMARTVADCIRMLDPADGLAIADAAARQGLTVSELDQVLRRQAGWPGIAHAREIAPLMSGRRDTVLESWSAWAFHVHDLPAPQWQINILDGTGRWCGRVDCWWEEGLVGESDGRAKYRLAAAERPGTPGERLAGVLDAERQREQAIRRTGAELERWGAGDVLNGDKARLLTAHLRKRLVKLTASPSFTGSIKPAR